MTTNAITLSLLVVGFIWMGALTVFLVKATSKYKQLTKGSDNLDLGRILEGLLKKSEENTKVANQLSAELTKLENTNRQNFQKYALIRFNPFEDTGGDQSFALSILDDHNNGIVISSLHSRTGTRVYAKKVEQGKPASHEFSKEESEVVEKAIKK